jgi:hypothetical protein
MTQYASTQTQTAYLSTEFGLALALRKFAPITEEQLASLMGRYTKGKRKGLLRGHVEWTKCTTGGWVRSGYGDGHVCRPGSYGYKLINGKGGAVLSEPGDYATGQFRVALMASLHGPNHPEVKIARLQEQLTSHDNTKDEMLKNFCAWRVAWRAKGKQYNEATHAAIAYIAEDCRTHLRAWFRARRKIKAELAGAQ